MTYTIEQRAGFPTIIGPNTTRQATNAEVELIAEVGALRVEVERLQSNTVKVPRELLETLLEEQISALGHTNTTARKTQFLLAGGDKA